MRKDKKYEPEPPVLTPPPRFDCTTEFRMDVEFPNEAYRFFALELYKSIKDSIKARGESTVNQTDAPKIKS